MKTGIVRRVDELGRVVLPAELRRTMDIGEKDLMEIYVEGESVVMRKYRPTCTFCDSPGTQVVFRGKNICRACLRELRELTGQEPEYDEKEGLLRLRCRLECSGWLCAVGDEAGTFLDFTLRGDVNT